MMLFKYKHAGLTYSTQHEHKGTRCVMVTYLALFVYFYGLDLLKEERLHWKAGMPPRHSLQTFRVLTLHAVYINIDA
jgi:hypothetical protein